MAISIEDLHFSYRRSNEELFSGLTHEFAEGKITALTGPSGRGKSTLLYILGMLLSPSSGGVVVDGVNTSALSDVRRSQLRATKFGFVFQDAALDSTRPIIDSVAEPALYAGWTRKSAHTRAAELLEFVQLGLRASHVPGQISGGQAQRAAVARALINDPQVVLADEPTGNLDRENAQAILSHFAFAAHSERRTVIVATHDAQVLDFADEVLTL